MAARVPYGAAGDCQQVTVVPPPGTAGAAVSTSVALAILIWLLVANGDDHYWPGVSIGVLAQRSIKSIVRNRIVPLLLTLDVPTSSRRQRG